MSRLPKILKTAADALFYFVLGVIALTLVIAAVVTMRGSVDADMVVPIALRPDASAITLQSETYGAGEIQVLTGVANFEEVGSPGHVAQALVMVAAFLAAMIWMLQLLRRIFASVAAGEPFSDKNRQRIRTIGVLVIAAEIIGQTVIFLLQQAVASNAVATGATLAANFTLNPTTVLLGLLIVVLAEAFRRGAELQAESDLTV